MFNSVTLIVQCQHECWRRPQRKSMSSRADATFIQKSCDPSRHDLRTAISMSSSEFLRLLTLRPLIYHLPLESSLCPTGLFSCHSCRFIPQLLQVSFLCIFCPGLSFPCLSLRTLTSLCCYFTHVSASPSPPFGA
jgi:hypothetical protein